MIHSQFTYKTFFVVISLTFSIITCWATLCYFTMTAQDSFSCNCKPVILNVGQGNWNCLKLLSLMVYQQTKYARNWFISIWMQTSVRGIIS